MDDIKKVIDHLQIIHTWNAVGKAYAHYGTDKWERTKTIEWIDDALELLKEQEAEIRQLRLALDITKGLCSGISLWKVDENK